MITVSVKLYGAFRKYGEKIELSVTEGSPVSAVKKALAAQLGNESMPLIGDSVLANDEAILPPDYVLDKDGSLSILPPVCGG